jgi:hypothetical protein
MEWIVPDFDMFPEYPVIHDHIYETMDHSKVNGDHSMNKSTRRAPPESRGNGVVPTVTTSYEPGLNDLIP